jgi:hypothetical protein
MQKTFEKIQNDCAEHKRGKRLICLAVAYARYSRRFVNRYLKTIDYRVQRTHLAVTIFRTIDQFTHPGGDGCMNRSVVGMESLFTREMHEA